MVILRLTCCDGGRALAVVSTSWAAPTSSSLNDVRDKHVELTDALKVGMGANDGCEDEIAEGKENPEARIIRVAGEVKVVEAALQRVVVSDRKGAGEACDRSGRLALRMSRRPAETGSRE